MTTYTETYTDLALDDLHKQHRLEASRAIERFAYGESLPRTNKPEDIRDAARQLAESLTMLLDFIDAFVPAASLGYIINGLTFAVPVEGNAMDADQARAVILNQSDRLRYVQPWITIEDVLDPEPLAGGVTSYTLELESKFSDGRVTFEGQQLIKIGCAIRVLSTIERVYTSGSVCFDESLVSYLIAIDRHRSAIAAKTGYPRK